jgi:hypothetical protein
MTLTPLPPSDVLIHLPLSETIFFPLPLRTAEISSVGGVRIFSGTTHFTLRRDFFIHWFTDLPTVNIQKVKNKKNFERQQFYDFS